MVDLLDASVAGERLALDDVDMDNDLRELVRVAGREALVGLAREVLRAREPLPDCRAVQGLGPELDAEYAALFLRLVAVNLAFRLRTDGLLADLLAFAAEAPAPRPDPAAIGALLARARSVAAARALIEASPLSDSEREAALQAAVVGPVPVEGARLHLAGTHDAVARALERALRPATAVPWSLVGGGAGLRRFLALRPRGDFVTVLEEGDRPPAELADHLARAGGLSRVVWASFSPAGDDLRVLEGNALALDRALLAARLGREPERDDVTGALRALGVLDLDPDHPRGIPKLTFAGASTADLKKRNMRAYAFA